MSDDELNLNGTLLSFDLITVLIDFNNDRFARNSGENAADKYKKQMQERQLKLKTSGAAALNKGVKQQQSK
jgi:hypothetical protein